MKKLIPILAFLGTLQSAFAQNFGPLETLAEGLFQVGSFAWVSDQLSATRFSIFIITFALIYWVLHLKSSSGKQIIADKRISVVIAFAFAAIATIFIPNGLVAQVGEAYSGFLAIILIGAPVFAILAFGIAVTREEKDAANVPHWNSPVARHTIRFITAMVALALLGGVAQEYGFGYGFFVLLLLKENWIKKWLRF